MSAPESHPRGAVRFDRNRAAADSSFRFLGSGEPGGKAAGLAFIKEAVDGRFPGGLFRGLPVDIPRMTVLLTGVFEEFIASNGLDFGFVPTALTIPAGEQSNDFVIFGSPDELPEGDETIIVTLQPDPFYIIGSPGSITITLKDRPWDDWRFSHFTASELTNAAISGEQADPEADDLPNLLEYAFNFDPHSPDTARGFSGAVEFIPVTGMDHLVVTFTRRKPPTDISYQVEVSSDLRTWSSGPQVTQEMLPPIDDGNGITETARVRLLNSTEQDGYRFVRLKVAKLGRSSGGINGQP